MRVVYLLKTSTKHIRSVAVMPSRCILLQKTENRIIFRSTATWNLFYLRRYKNVVRLLLAQSPELLRSM